MSGKATFDALQALSEQVSTRKDVADLALNKTAIGIEFSTKNLVNPKPLSEGTTILTHAPPDGDAVRLARDASDNSLRIINDATGNTSAIFLRNGTANITLTAGAVDTTQLAGLSVTNSKIAGLAVTNSKIGLSAVNRNNMSSDTENQSQGTSSMREISGSGGSLACAASNHLHASVNFNTNYTLTEKEHSANLKTTVEGMRNQQQFLTFQPLIDLVLDLAHQLLDDIDAPVQEKVSKLKTDPAYAHEFYMKYDPAYFAAWAIEFVPEYASKVEDDPRIQEMAANAIAKYGKVEDSPAIVEDYKRRHPRIL